MATSFKRLLIGKPIATEQQHHERLNKITALAVFSSDVLSITCGWPSSFRCAARSCQHQYGASRPWRW
jgi:hypothetical protein